MLHFGRFRFFSLRDGHGSVGWCSKLLLPGSGHAARSRRAHSSPIDCKTSKEPNIIGPYKLLYRLGEGGMGQVWLAEQTEPVHRTVALKFIRIGMYDETGQHPGDGNGRQAVKK
jgi:serine/threonine protein kinase